jgi:hypothetical protein
VYLRGPVCSAVAVFEPDDVVELRCRDLQNDRVFEGA